MRWGPPRRGGPHSGVPAAACGPKSVESTLFGSRQWGQCTRYGVLVTINMLAQGADDNSCGHISCKSLLEATGP